jgi:hypothetical protein
LSKQQYSHNFLSISAFIARGVTEFRNGGTALAVKVNAALAAKKSDKILVELAQQHDIHPIAFRHLPDAINPVFSLNSTFCHPMLKTK